MPTKAPATELPATREAKRLATNRVIEEAALKLFMAQGFDAPTAADIAHEAGVSVRTFFRHFPGGKENVMLLEARRAMRQLKEALEARPPQEPAVTAVREAVRSLPWYAGEYRNDSSVLMFAQILNGHPDLLARMLGERQLLAEPLVELVALRMSADPMRDPRPRMLIHGLHAAMTTTWLMWLSDPDIDVSALFESTFDLVVGGISVGTNGALVASSAVE